MTKPQGKFDPPQEDGPNEVKVKDGQNETPQQLQQPLAPSSNGSVLWSILGLAMVGFWIAGVLGDNFFPSRGIGFPHGLTYLGFWILMCDMTLFLIGTGLLGALVLQFINKELKYYFDQFYDCNWSFLIVQVLFGVILTWIVLPIWLTFRECSMGSFVDRMAPECSCWIWRTYFEMVESICSKSKSGVYGIPSVRDLGKCETIGYAVPITIFSLVPLLVLTCVPWVSGHWEAYVNSLGRSTCPTVVHGQGQGQGPSSNSNSENAPS